MEALGSVSFPIPSFHSVNGNEATPADLLQFLRRLVAEHLATTDRISFGKDAWVTLSLGLTEHFLLSFPSPTFGPWQSLHEKVRLSEVTLDIIHRVALRVDKVFSWGEEHACKVIFRLFKFLVNLNEWSPPDSADVLNLSASIITAKELRVKATQTIIAVLNCLKEVHPMEFGKRIPSDQNFHQFANRLLTEIKGIKTSARILPISFSLFGNSITLQEQVRGHIDNHDNLHTFLSESQSHLATLYVTFLNIITCYLVHCQNQSFLSGFVAKVWWAIWAMVDFLFSASNEIPIHRRSELVVLLIEVLLNMKMLKVSCPLENVVTSIILTWRTRKSIRVIEENMDTILQNIILKQPFIVKPEVASKLILDSLHKEDWGESGRKLRFCGYIAVKMTAPKMLFDAAFQESYSLLSANANFDDITTSAQQREQLVDVSVETCCSSQRNILEEQKSTVWRLDMKRRIKCEILSVDIDWNFEASESDNDGWMASVISAIVTKLVKRSPDDLTVGELAALSQISGDMNSALTSLGYSSSVSKAKAALNSLSAVIVDKIFARSKSKETTSFDQKHLFHIIIQCLTCTELGDDRLNLIANFAMSGLQNANRNIRLIASQVIAEAAARRNSHSREGQKHLEDIFRMLYTLMRRSLESIKETALLAAGLIGRSSDAECLGRAICFLFAFLDQNNILLKGITYLQLITLAKHHKKSPYLLVAPYMHQVAMYLVSNICRQPDNLTEACRFLSLSPGEFLAVTLPHTLPNLFGNCHLEALYKIGQEIGKKVSMLFLNASPEILAHIYMLKTQAQTDKALNFVVSVLSDAANKAKIDAMNVVGSCIVPLLATLVIATGIDDKSQAENAFTAIKKVEFTLRSPNNRKAASIGEFLRTYVLGVIAHMNDVLHDVQGKKTFELKKQVLHGLRTLIMHVGSSASSVAPQIMATLQTAVHVPALADSALMSWDTFIRSLTIQDLGAHVGPTSATLVSVWPDLEVTGRQIAHQLMEFIVIEKAQDLGHHSNEIVDFANITELVQCTSHMNRLRQNISISDRIKSILQRTYSDNTIVVTQSLKELRLLMKGGQEKSLRDYASGDGFDPLVGQVIRALLCVVCRDGETVGSMRLLAFECIGLLGALDPDRFDIPNLDSQMVVLKNFADEGESVSFAVHLIETILVRAFRSTSDIKYQSHLAYAIQELLKFCRFTPDLVISTSSSSIPLKVRTRWNALPKHVLETVTPLLESRFTLNYNKILPDIKQPIYLYQATYREWIQLWATHLISRVSGQKAQTIFDVFRSAIKNKDVGVASHLLPHLVLNILISGSDADAENIRIEFIAVLEDQISLQSSSSSDKRLLSAQAIFMLMDHLNRWIRIVRQENSSKRNETKRVRHSNVLGDAEEQLIRVDSILASIDQDLIAKAAFQCKAYARSLMNFEKQILTVQGRGMSGIDLQVYYDRLHEIYSHLDEPDGMEGVSTCIMMPSLEHQIRQHESTGGWTSAQSCWEVRLQDSPDNLEYHLGLMRCLRNLGHYDTLRTHIRGILTKNPSWANALVGFRIESAWMANDWIAVQTIVESSNVDGSEVAIAKVLLAMRSFDETAINDALSAARYQLGMPIMAAGEKGYRRAYDAVLNLHMVQDLEIVYNNVHRSAQINQVRHVMSALSMTLASRLNSTLPTFRTREPVLNMHRTAFSLVLADSPQVSRTIGLAWLDSAKIARKSGHWQTAYSAVLQAQKYTPSLAFLQSSKLVKAIGEPLRALHELNNALGGLEITRQQTNHTKVIDLTDDNTYHEDSIHDIETRAKLLRARWMQESERFDASIVHKELSELSKTVDDSENAHFHAGHFQDECFKGLHGSDKRNRGPRMNLYTVKAYSMAIRTGTKYAYQTIPRLLTLWLDMGEDNSLAQGEVFKSINNEVESAIECTPVYKWLTAFPQIVSRVEHKNTEVNTVLSKLIITVLRSYPQQGLWLFMSVVNSTKPKREKRGLSIIDQLKSHPEASNSTLTDLINQCLAMSAELLRLCDFPIKDETKTLSMSKDFPALAKLAPSPLIIPLQESLTVSLPSSSVGSEHQPFPQDAPTIAYFFDDITVMKSLAKPRKITIRGDNGQIFMFLGKPKDDLRKDARLMDFNSIINKLLRKNSESRRRQLHIRTYSVVTLNEECGFIQWVPNTIPIRPILIKYYLARGIESWSRELTGIFSKIKEASDKEASKIFQQKVLTNFPPIFHEWFIETFPEPSAWLSSRLAYGRTAAVMSMVGFILGLGDRHLENILLDTNTGDVVHVDFNCLFEKGKSLETPERVPFRLTNNIIDALGVTGVEGVFRIASEITMQLLRDNKDALMSVLDAFVHDPLVEWEDEKRRMERQTRGDRNAVKESVDLRKLAKNALSPIEKKLRGLYNKESSKNEKGNKEISTSNLVQMLIEEATDLRNLAKMYPGWVPWH